MLGSDSQSASIDSENGAWYVYLLPSSDCATFKVGFSCNPLQRIHSFNSRYFERFALHESILLRVDSCSIARDVEATLKKSLAEFRAECPPWVRCEAGGHTEWFSSVNYAEAMEEVRLCARNHDSSRYLDTLDHIRGELMRSLVVFEPWAAAQAHRLQEDFISMSLGYERTTNAESLRDWVDAYRFFGIPLFNDDPTVLEFVIRSTRPSG